METSIIPQDDGYLVSFNEKKDYFNNSPQSQSKDKTAIFFPNAELLNVGCKNCIWKLHSQCPYGLKDDEAIEFTEFEEKGKESTKTFKVYPDSSSKTDLSLKSPSCEKPYGDDCGYCAECNSYQETVEKSTIRGICPDMIQFLLTFADKSNSLTAIWEKFYNYKIRLQESIDYRDYIELNKKIREMESDLKSAGWSEKQIEEMQRLKSDRMAAKIWWAKLHQYASFTMQKIVDRETKQNEMPRLAGIHSSGTINFNIKQEAKQIEDKN